jgi:lysophospholipase L1-like esterase
MITNAEAETVLCFGDSNTFGVPADHAERGRLPSDVRWSGVLQRRLGDRCRVIEEGLGGRTTDLDYLTRAGRNGRTYFAPCLESHAPLVVVIIMLGTNDLKAEFDRSPQQVARALLGYIDDIERLVRNRDGRSTNVVLVSPILVDPSQPRFAELNLATYGPNAATKARGLAMEIELVAQERGASFLDAAAVATAGSDGVHLSLESHAPLGELVARRIEDLLPR